MAIETVIRLSHSYPELLYARVSGAEHNPLQKLKELDGSRLAIFERQGSQFVPYDSAWMPDVGLGLTLWQGCYEGVTVEWLR